MRQQNKLSMEYNMYAIVKVAHERILRVLYPYCMHGHTVDLIPLICKNKPNCNGRDWWIVKKKRIVSKTTISHSWRTAKRSEIWYSNELVNDSRGFAKECLRSFRRKLQFFFSEICTYQ